ncbi:MAG TPA: iron uptake transporter deferrochelatase/peroxidase subunit [Microbacteriaceae bacterium]
MPEHSHLSRRGLFAGAVGGLAAGALADVGGTIAVTAAASTPDADVDGSLTYPFYGGSHQAGIQTEQQRYAVLMTFDLAFAAQSDLQVLLARWSAAIAQLMQGKTIGSPAPTRSVAVPIDTGEALDLGPHGLTVTVGLGPGIFDERFGLARRKPALFAPLPTLPSDQLDPALTGGDLSLQACADDPQVAYHAIRNLARMARDTVSTRWSVMGFGRASAGPHQQTPRNLMGFKDGTRNVSTDDDFAAHVWVPGSDQAWMEGGTYQVARKIQMNVEIWDADHIGDQQTVFGRTKLDGAPLSGGSEHTTPDFHARDKAGDTRISDTAHIALAAHENNGGIKILRRSYNYTDGISQFGQMDAGLLFIAYMNDPAHFVTLQKKLGAVDRLNEYISHVGSAVFAIPPAPKVGSYIGESLFA